MIDQGAPVSSRLVGQVLHDRYRVDAELGHGGMGSVFLAFDQRLQRRAVIKIPRLDLINDPQLIARFLSEVRDLSTHQHPYILTIEDFGEHEGVPFAVLRYLGGGDLSDRLQRAGGVLTLDQVLEWLPPMAAALDFIHAKGCLHRDVKPGNILFDDQGNPFLSDFGISTAMDHIDTEAPTVTERAQLTALGSFVGSPAYAPPEAIDRVLSPGYDQYALATVVYSCLCGHLPYSGATSEAILIAKSKDDPPPMPDTMRAGALPKACEKAIMRALSRDHTDRFESCTAFAEALVAGAQAGAAKTPRGRWALIALAAAALAGASWVLLQSEWFSRRSEENDPILTVSGSQPVLLGSTEDDIERARAICEAAGHRCSDDSFADEDPHRYEPIALDVDRTEVRNVDFARYIEGQPGLKTQAEERGYSWDGPTKTYGNSWREPADGLRAEAAPNHPVVHLTADEAAAYCEYQGARLPTADEWEYAARGQARRLYPWGDSWSADRLRFDRSGFGLEDVGSHPGGATPEGVLDMAGSVWEWTSTRRDGGVVAKGGSWDVRSPSELRAAYSLIEPPDKTASDIGFRCVRER